MALAQLDASAQNTGFSRHLPISLLALPYGNAVFKSAGRFGVTARKTDASASGVDPGVYAGARTKRRRVPPPQRKPPPTAPVPPVPPIPSTQSSLESPLAENPNPIVKKPTELELYARGRLTNSPPNVPKTHVVVPTISIDTSALFASSSSSLASSDTVGSWEQACGEDNDATAVVDNDVLDIKKEYISPAVTAAQQLAGRIAESALKKVRIHAPDLRRQRSQTVTANDFPSPPPPPLPPKSSRKHSGSLKQAKPVLSIAIPPMAPHSQSQKSILPSFHDLPVSSVPPPSSGPAISVTVPSPEIQSSPKVTRHKAHKASKDNTKLLKVPAPAAIASASQAEISSKQTARTGHASPPRLPPIQRSQYTIPSSSLPSSANRDVRKATPPKFSSIDIPYSNSQSSLPSLESLRELLAVTDKEMADELARVRAGISDVRRNVRNYRRERKREVRVVERTTGTKDLKSFDHDGVFIRVPHVQSSPKVRS